MNNNNLKDSNEIDSLLELSKLIRELISQKEYDEINIMINYTLNNCYYEAFSWILLLLQETFESSDSTLADFSCKLGNKIDNFDEFLRWLGVKLIATENNVEYAYESSGEVSSVYNIQTYKTKYKNVDLVSIENFDTKDNDFIEYKLFFHK